MYDPVNDVLNRISEDHIAEAALYRCPASAFRRKALRVLLAAACCAALLAVGTTAWKLYLHVDLESDGSRRYLFRLVEDIPATAPTEVEAVYLPDMEALGLDYRIAYCTTQPTPSGDGVSTVYYSDATRQRISVQQFTLYAFQSYTRKVVSAEFVHTEGRTVTMGKAEVLCIGEDGGIYDIYWSDGSYCYCMYASRPMTEAQWAKLVTAFAPAEDYAAIAAAHPYYFPDSGTVDHILVPSVLPEGIRGTFDWGISPYWADWTIYDENGYGVHFQQTPLDQKNYYTEYRNAAIRYGGDFLYWFTAEGKVINVCESSGFRDYLWYESGDECLLRFDKETALDFDALAKQIIPTLQPMDASAAEACYQSLK